MTFRTEQDNLSSIMLSSVGERWISVMILIDRFATNDATKSTSLSNDTLYRVGYVSLEAVSVELNQNIHHI